MPSTTVKYAWYDSKECLLYSVKSYQRDTYKAFFTLVEGILTSKRRHFHLQKGGSGVEVKRGTSTLGNIDVHKRFRRFGGGGSEK